jgi:hypothetical protein
MTAVLIIACIVIEAQIAALFFLLRREARSRGLLAAIRELVDEEREELEKARKQQQRELEQFERMMQFNGGIKDDIDG